MLNEQLQGIRDKSRRKEVINKNFSTCKNFRKFKWNEEIKLSAKNRM